MIPVSPDLRESEFAPDPTGVRMAKEMHRRAEQLEQRRREDEAFRAQLRKTEARVERARLEAVQRGEVWKPPKPKPLPVHTWLSPSGAHYCGTAMHPYY